MLHAVKALNEQALRAYNNLHSTFDPEDMDTQTKFSHFYAIVFQILIHNVLKCVSFITLQTWITFISSFCKII